MPAREKMKNETCPVARSVDIIGDRWSLLIVRDAFDGMRRFSDFQRSLGMARNILSDRLHKLVNSGIGRHGLSGIRTDGKGGAFVPCGGCATPVGRAASFCP